MKLAIVTTHPIQYNAPLFALLAERAKIEIMVFYTWGKEVLENKYDPGFRKIIEWDIPLLQGYPYCFVENTSKEKGSHHFRGIINPGLNNAIESWGADAVLVYGWSFVSHLKAMRYFKGKIPVLFRGDSTLIDKQSGFKKIARKLWLTRVFKLIDFALYTGSNNKQYFKAFGLPEKKMVFAPHCIDNNRFSAIGKNSNRVLAWKHKMSIPEDAIILLYVGKLEPKKNPLLLFEIMKQMDTSGLHLIIVGDGILAKAVKEEAELQNRIHFIGFQNQNVLPLIYAAADVFILPSKGPGETWGLCINEAMAAGCAIVATSKVGGAIDLIDEGKNGIIFSDNIKPVVSYLTQLIQNRALLEQASLYSLRKIDDFSFTHTARAIESTCLNAVQKYKQW